MDGIEKLRVLHVELLQEVLRAYGWGDLAEKATRDRWEFTQPWIDETTRFVPPLDVRIAMHERLVQKNHERYHEEIALLAEHILEYVPPKGASITTIIQSMVDAGISPGKKVHVEAALQKLQHDGLLQEHGGKWLS